MPAKKPSPNIVPCLNCGEYFALSAGACPHCDTTPEAPVITVKKGAKKASKKPQKAPKKTKVLPAGTITEKVYESDYVEYTLILENGGELTASKRETLEKLAQKRE